jgi:hypothetical protein
MAKLIGKYIQEDFQFTKNGLTFSVDANIELYDDCVEVELTKVEVELFQDWTGLEISRNLEDELTDHLDGNEDFYNEELAVYF